MIKEHKSFELLEKIIIYIFFFIIFLIGISIYDDFNVHSDESIQRWVGNIYYLFIKNAINTKNIYNIYHSEIVYYLGHKDFRDWFIYPIFFDLISEIINDLLNVNDTEEIFKNRHLLNFIFFFISLIYLFFLILKRFNSFLLSVVSVLILFFCPRIFANAFYNSKDILFLSYVIISSYYAFELISKTTLKNFILFSIFTGLTINIRIIGIYLPLIIYFIILFDNLNDKIRLNFLLKKIFISLILILFFTFIFWPFLWFSPVNNFLIYLKWLLKEMYIIQNLYFGEIINSNYVPWHYLVVWIGITIPICILIFSSIGFIKSIIFFFQKILNFNENDTLLKNNYEKFDFYITTVLFCFIILSFDASNFSGWRHFYFLFFYIIYFSIFLLNYFRNMQSLKIYKISLLFLFLNYVNIIFWNFYNHPFQYVFFNKIKYYLLNKEFFDLDYFGISEKQALEYILRNDDRKIIKIYSFGYSMLEGSVSMLNYNERNRIKVSKLDDSDYLIDWSHQYFDKKDKLVDNTKFKKYYEIVIENNIINTIYKKI